MKKLIFLLNISLLTITAFAQAPSKMSYQAVVRGAANEILVNAVVGIQISILQGSAAGTAVYVETHSPTTNDNGLISLEIGNGAVVSGDINTIDWSVGPYFIKTETDPAGGTNYTITGGSELVSVPYALHANTAESVVNDQVDDADSDPTNEIQDISLSGSSLSISSGSTVDLSGIDTDTKLTESEVDAFVANNGYLTSAPPASKSILITPGMIPSSSFLGGTSLGSIGGWLHPCIDYPPGVSSMVRVSLPSPPDWDGSPMQFKVLYTSTGTTGNFNLLSQARGVAVGDNINQGPAGSGLILSPPPAANILAESTLTAGFGALKTNQAVMNIWFRRVGNASNDTSPDILRVVGFVITYNTN